MKPILVMKPGDKGRALASALVEASANAPVNSSTDASVNASVNASADALVNGSADAPVHASEDAPAVARLSHADRVFFWPAFHFEAAPESQRVAARIRRAAERGATLVLVSPTAAHFLHDAMPQMPKSGRFAAVGTPTQKEIHALWGKDHEVLCPAGGSLESGSEQLFEVFQERGFPNEVVIVRGQTGREYLFEALKEAGVSVSKEIIYERIPFEASRQEKEALHENIPGVVYLTSSDSVDILLANLGECDQAAIKRARAVTIHPRIEAKLRANGFESVTVIESGTHACISFLLSLANAEQSD